MKLPALSSFNSLMLPTPPKTLLGPIHFAGTDTVEITHPLSEENTPPVVQANKLLSALKNHESDQAKQILRATDDIAIHLKDANGATALEYAVRSGQFELVELVLAKGANVNERWTQGGTPLQYCVKHLTAWSDLTLLNWLLNTPGVDINLADVKGITPLMQVKTLDVLNRLLQEKPALNLQDSEGKTALIHLIERQQNFSCPQLKIVDALINAGADPTIPDKKGLSIIDYARFSDHFNLMEFLAQKTGLPLSGKVCVKATIHYLSNTRRGMGFSEEILPQELSTLKSKVSKVFKDAETFSKIFKGYKIFNSGDGPDQMFRKLFKNSQTEPAPPSEPNPKIKGMLTDKGLELFQTLATMLEKNHLKQMTWQWTVQDRHQENPHAHIVSFTLPQPGHLKIQYQDNETSGKADPTPIDVIEARDTAYSVYLSLENGSYVREGYNRDVGLDSFTKLNGESEVFTDILFNLIACLQNVSFRDMVSGREADGTKRYGPLLKTIDQNNQATVQQLRYGLTPEQLALWTMLVENFSESYRPCNVDPWVKEAKAFQKKYFLTA